METNGKINIAELLKDCPSGMELDCTMYEDVCFDFVDEQNMIHCFIQHEAYKTSVIFNQHGTPDSIIKSKCVIFPKRKTTWEGFQRQFTDGDIVTNIEGVVIIYKGITTYGYCGSFVSLDHYNQLIPHYESYLTGCIRFATEEEKAKLFQAIKDNGYKWNAEAKTLEKLIEPKFKVGDVIQDKDEYQVRITEVNLEDECYGYESMILKGIGSICFSEQDNYEFFPNKFEITTLKPFYKVLVRPDNRVCWECDFFSSYDSTGRDFGKFHCVGGWYKECIPYEGNEHLLGTTNDCSDFYKTW